MTITGTTAKASPVRINEVVHQTIQPYYLQAQSFCARDAERIARAVFNTPLACKDNAPETRFSVYTTCRSALAYERLG